MNPAIMRPVSGPRSVTQWFRARRVALLAAPLAATTIFTPFITSPFHRSGTAPVVVQHAIWAQDKLTPGTESFFGTSVPARPSDPDSASAEVGLRFRARDAGTVTAVRFYKGADNTGTHVGSLWNENGNRLATVTFTNESASGWQQAALSTPLHLTAGADYVVSYSAPKGHYASDEGSFSTPRATASLFAYADSEGRNGMYKYGGGFPTASHNATNYYVDVVFTADPVTGRSRGTMVATTAPPTTAPPATSPPATSPPSTGGFPNASNTGVPAGTVLSPSGSITVNTAGTVIDSRDVSGTISINASNVTVRRSRIRASAFSLIWIKSGVTGVLIEDSEIDGRGTSGTSNSMGVMGPATVLRSNIYGVENGVTPYGNSVIQDNYIHNLGAPGSPHYDGIQIDGGQSNVMIRHNTILNQFNQTAAVMIDNYFGPISNITVDNNRLVGGGFTVYSDGQFSGGSITGVKFTNNRFGRGAWGYASVVNNTIVDTGNVDDTTGAAIDLG